MSLCNAGGPVLRAECSMCISRDHVQEHQFTAHCNMIRNTQHKSPPSWEHSHDPRAHGQDYANVRQFVWVWDVCGCVCVIDRQKAEWRRESERMKWHKNLIFLMFFLSEHTACLNTVRLFFFVTPTLYCLVTFLSFSLPLLLLFKLFLPYQVAGPQHLPRWHRPCL